MAKIDFIIVNQNAQRHRDTVFASAVKQYYDEGKKIAIYCEDSDRMRWLDRVLWTFDPASFIAHRVIKQHEDYLEGINEVLLSHDIDFLPDGVEVLFVESISTYIDEKAPQIVEIIGNKENQVQVGRTRFSYYRQKGLEPSIVKVD